MKKLKILSVKSLGIKPVYDMEVPNVGNFLLANGVVAHNCKAHAVSYSIIGFVCAYLKHHFPLEWWTAVLCNADKNEISEKFWKYCGKLINMPDVSLSGENFKIHNERIQAPISLLHGVGEGALKELCTGRPYASIDDFCQKINETKTKKTKVDPETGKKRLGTSALNRGVVYTLIITGAMDSILPKTRTLSDGTIRESNVVDWLEMYEEAIAKATNKKKVGVNSKYDQMTQLARFQICKAALPAYNAPLLDIFVSQKINTIIPKDGGGYTYNDGRDSYNFVDLSEIEYINSMAMLPPGGVKIAVPVFVESIKKFSWGPSKEKDACKVILNIDGNSTEYVKWGNKNTGKVSKDFGIDLVGSVSIAILSKFSDSKPFSLEDVILVQKPLEAEKEISA